MIILISTSKENIFWSMEISASLTQLTATEGMEIVLYLGCLVNINATGILGQSLLCLQSQRGQAAVVSRTLEVLYHCQAIHIIMSMLSTTTKHNNPPEKLYLQFLLPIPPSKAFNETWDGIEVISGLYDGRVFGHGGVFVPWREDRGHSTFSSCTNKIDISAS